MDVAEKQCEKGGRMMADKTDIADIGIIGAGSWGTALAVLLHKNGCKVTLWSIIKEEIEMLKREHEHKDKLPGVKLPEEMVFTTELEEAIKEKDILVLAVPSPYTRSTSRSMKEYVAKGQIVVNVAKGIEEKACLLCPRLLKRRFRRRKWQCCPVLPMRRK